ncbi:MAG TPA: tetratricopeptide repeat protein [Candidatus Hydrogenedentes bacterium]|nr:tetratricopeptide repeat protein [Candidatus Hydrogenedentota bacterium]HOV74928.1 tetratricopeptide repeat protein [Candidatus Hydrogenedentota bacterium]HPC18414.1 tetratricopeptide repeat protein [Candidatus Hydrogenedentota bacterium]HRT21795.1 tetratricopeptide repeat protein [Candidatus Hydrogenedentota bacterium]HRT66888.1 tetratricopeptide repeat protein [Candidatus Hydrogenedentota bacterium]
MSTLDTKESLHDPLGRKRPWGVRAGVFLLLILLPFVFAGVFEGILRVSGYGQSNRFLLEKTFGGQTYHVTNPAFYQQFMTMPVGKIMNLDDLGFRVPAQKAADVYRIFIFGESAALGCTPDAAYGLAPMLEVILGARFPSLRFEVYNASCPALNSHVMRYAAEACAALEPDLFIVYMGNNEFSGPFGPAWGSDRAASPAAIRVWVTLGDLRTVQWLRNMLWRPWLPRAQEAGEYLKALRRCRPDSPPCQAMRGRFRDNLDAIRTAGVKAGAKVFFCSVGSNLRDWRPFASMHPPGWDKSKSEPWDAHFRKGRARQETGAYAEAIEAYRQAAALDDSHAELQYRMGVCCLRLGMRDEAVAHFRRARDYDCLPMRTDSEQNRIIAETAARGPSDRVQFIDLEAILSERGESGMAGNDLFWDFVHFTFTGTHAAAAALSDRIAAVLPEPARAHAASAPLDQSDCERRMAFTPPVLLRHVKELLPAFRFWGVDEDYVAGLLRQESKLEMQVGANGADIEAEGYRQALAFNAGGYYVLSRYARLLLEKGDAPGAIELARKMLVSDPVRPAARRLLIDALEKAGQQTEALRERRTLQELFPGEEP